jgi:hypothetical protein
MRKLLCPLVVTVVEGMEEVVTEGMAAVVTAAVVTAAVGMAAVGMAAEDMEAVGMAAVGMSMWITWYCNCLREKKSQNISTFEVKIL